MWGTGELQVGSRPTILHRITASDGSTRYEVLDFRHEEGGQAAEYADAYAAAHALKRAVGGAALSRALSEHRYTHLFPNGSSLEWPAKAAPIAQAAVARRTQAA